MTLDPQAASVMQAVEQSGLPPLETLSPEAARAQYEKGCAMVGGRAPQLFAVREMAVPGPRGDIGLRVYTPRDPAGEAIPLLIYFHGGGYVIGSLDSHDIPCRHLALNGDCMVISVDYRMAPEYPYPAPLEDCWAAVNAIVEQTEALGVCRDRIAIGGDSAGGSLATATCLKARAEGGPRFVYQMLIYPGTDRTRSLPSHSELGEGYLLTRSLLDWFMSHYFSGEPAGTNDPYSSPLYVDDLRGLPPTLVVSAGYDPLRDEDIAYYEKLRAHGNAAEHLHYPGMIHGFIDMTGVVDAARDCLEGCGMRLRQVFADRTMQ